jgi:hypothetical protein
MVPEFAFTVPEEIFVETKFDKLDGPVIYKLPPVNPIFDVSLPPIIASKEFENPPIFINDADVKYNACVVLFILTSPETTNAPVEVLVELSVDSIETEPGNT